MQELNGIPKGGILWQDGAVNMVSFGDDPDEDCTMTIALRHQGKDKYDIGIAILRLPNLCYPNIVLIKALLVAGYLYCVVASGDCHQS